MIYTPALKNDFVYFDDNDYIYENNYIRSLNLHTFSWMLTTFHASNWHPLTWLSHATDYAIWGLNPFGHHLTSIILHSMNTFLVFLLVVQLMLKGQMMNKAPSPSSGFGAGPAQPLIAAAVTALLFGIHPLHVESVGWVAERKDVLCAYFFLLTLCSYLLYSSSTATTHQRNWFVACVAFSAAALMAKPMAVTLPLILLLLDIYPLKRITLYPHTSNKNLSLLLEKVPFFFLSLVSGGITVLAQRGEIRSFETLPLQLRLLNALHSPFFYLSKIVWPAGLVPFYPIPQTIGFFDLTHAISGMLALSITGGCIWLWMRGRILCLIVWAYYLITLLPVVGIVQVGIQAAADRYTYLPSISIFLVAGIAVAQLFAVLMGRKNIIIPGGVIVVLIFIVFGQMTVKQIKIWQDSETLWRYVIKSFPGRLLFAHNNLGLVYESKGLHDKAAAEYEKVLAINPTHEEAHINLGMIYLRKGEYDKAVEEFEKVLAINPTHARACNNLGIAYLRKGKYDKAVEEFEKALASNSNLAEAQNNLGNVYLERGEYHKAIEAYEKALASNPNLARVYFNLGNAYYTKGMFDEAIAQYEKALAIDPNLAEVHNGLGNSYYKISNYSDAAAHFAKALALGYKVDLDLLESVKHNRP